LRENVKERERRERFGDVIKEGERESVREGEGEC